MRLGAALRDLALVSVNVSGGDMCSKTTLQPQSHRTQHVIASSDAKWSGMSVDDLIAFSRKSGHPRVVVHPSVARHPVPVELSVGTSNPLVRLLIRDLKRLSVTYNASRVLTWQAALAVATEFYGVPSGIAVTIGGFAPFSR